MNELKYEVVKEYIELNIGDFHSKRIENLKTLKLTTVLKKKNPYLFRTKHLVTSEQVVKSLANAFLSSNEETIFGNWLEGLAIFINSKVYNGWKSSAEGIDLEFNDDEEIHYLVDIKSGPNWGNSDQIKRMKSNFKSAIKTLRTSNNKINAIAVNGCCYGKDNKPNKGDYFKYCGQKFWYFISGSADLYVDIIEPLGLRAKENNEEFDESYIKMINLFTKEFIDKFCLSDGQIDWKKLVEFNSKCKNLIF